ncbi:MAG: transposase, partial [Ignavibacteria bacterium]|nr:transposase [Ignavibacteria bacterium]
RIIFQQVPEVKRLLWGGEFWTKGFYINTVGKAANEQAISNYVKNQGSKYKQIYNNQPKLFEGL